MEKLVDTAKGKFKRIADHMESSLKGFTYRADLAAKVVAKIVKGALNGQHRP